LWSFTADAIICAVGFTVGLAAMHLIAGPAQGDRLARTR
jgi:hypothetical protein